MSVANVPGFLPVLEAISTPLPIFLVSLSITSIPLFVLKYSVIFQYLDFYKMLNSNINSLFTVSSTRQSFNEYDFIVVGGGSAGSVVATSLAEEFKVLLLEAGGDPHPLTYVPLMANPLLNLPMIDWQFQTQPLNNSGFVWPNQRMAWPRGKSLGGTSNSNHMIYMRGNPEDFNNWSRHTGDQRWSYENVENIYKRIENYHGHWEGSAHHGEKGPLYIEKAKYAPSASYWLDAGKEIGKRVNDPNAYQTEGFFPLDVTQKKGVRFSAFRAYIEPNLNNPNLTIHRYSVATKINFDEEMRAVGVTYYRHAIKKYASATKEIIISCGTINSPKLLMLSGIGPKEHLQKMKIKPLVDLKVGHNLQDHVVGIAGPFLFNKNVSFLRSRDVTPLTAAEYLATGKGPFSSPDGLSATALIASKSGDKNWPNIIMTHAGRGIDKNMGKEMEKAFGMKPNSAFSPFLEYNAMNDSDFVFVGVARPKSRGFIKLASPDPFDKPIIDPNYFSDANGEDLDTLIEGLEFVVNLYEKTTTYQSIGARLAPNHFPGCESHKLKSRDYWKCYILQNPQTMFHPAGTCMMGRIDQSNSVVDSELRVIGTKGLRVADASIMPFITNSNLLGPTLMIGTICADIVKDSYQSDPEKFH